MPSARCNPIWSATPFPHGILTCGWITCSCRSRAWAAWHGARCFRGLTSVRHQTISRCLPSCTDVSTRRHEEIEDPKKSHLYVSFVTFDLFVPFVPFVFTC